MIDETDRFLINWITGTVDATAQLGIPDDEAAGDLICLYLLCATPTMPPRHVVHEVMQLKLTYLVMIDYEQAAAAHHHLAELLFAAMQQASLELVMEPIPLDLWTALRIRPRPAFRLNTYIQRERAQPTAKPVLKPLVLDVGSIGELYGQVLGPADLPIVDATIECPELGLHTGTDPSGRFHLSGVPRQIDSFRLRIRAKRRVVEVVVDKPTTPESPYIVRLDPLSEAVD